MADFDILIIGGGIAGASLAAAIGRRARVAILEAEDQCGYHSTGRSAAFWLASYGGPGVMPLTIASHPALESGWPANERPWLRRRGALYLGDRDVRWDEVASIVPAADPAARWIEGPELAAAVPGLKAPWVKALLEPSCADIDVAGLHQACLAAARRDGAEILTSTELEQAVFQSGRWTVATRAGDVRAPVLVNAAGAWADRVAQRCGVEPLGLEPRRRTMAQLRVGRSGLADLPLVIDAGGSFYFKGEADSRIWLSPHDETATDPCDAAPEELDVATAIDRFQAVVDWPVEAVERTWAGLRTFARDRMPVIGFDENAPGYFWCAGQGGFGIQTAPAAAAIAAALLLGESLPEFVEAIDPRPYAPGRLRI